MIQFRKELFWDINFSTLDIEKHKNLIVERVLSFGNLDEFNYLLSLYSYQTIKQINTQLGYLDPKTIAFVSGFFKIDKMKMRCYIQKL